MEVAAIAVALLIALIVAYVVSGYAEFDDNDVWDNDTYPICTERGREFGAVISDKMREGEWHE